MLDVTEVAPVSPAGITDTVAVNPSPYVPFDGRFVIETVGVACPTEMNCCAQSAAYQLELPDWLASTMHVPAPVKLTTPLEIEHAPDVLELSMENVTVSPDVAMAVGVYVEPPRMTGDGFVEVKVITLVPLPTLKL